MDLTGQEIHFVGFLSSAKDTLKRAKAIISLAESSPKNAKTLAACATVLLSAALEQAVATVLSDADEKLELERVAITSETKRPIEYRTSIWWRVQQAPSVLTKGKFRLDHNHKLTKALRELIDTRNALMHVDEPAMHLVGPSKDVKIEKDGIRVNFWRPLNPWGSVKLEKVRTFQQAVEVYFNEVLFPESGKIKQGTIIIPRP